MTVSVTVNIVAGNTAGASVTAIDSLIARSAAGSTPGESRTAMFSVTLSSADGVSAGASLTTIDSTMLMTAGAGMTVTVTSARLFPGVGSLSAASMVIVSVNGPAVCGVRLRVNATNAPADTWPSVQATTPAVPAGRRGTGARWQVRADEVDVRRDGDANHDARRVHDTSLVTVIAYLTSSPMSTDSGAALTASDSSTTSPVGVTSISTVSVAVPPRPSSTVKVTVCVPTLNVGDTVTPVRNRTGPST